jgi:hypothetical protein
MVWIYPEFTVFGSRPAASSPMFAGVRSAPGRNLCLTYARRAGAGLGPSWAGTVDGNARRFNRRIGTGAGQGASAPLQPGWRSKGD